MAKLSPRFPSRRSVAATIAISAFAAVLSSLSHPAALRVDGHRMISDVPPVTTAKGAYVPLRAVAESLGAKAYYDERTGTIQLVRGRDTLRVRVGDRAATLNGRTLALKNAPFAVRGRAMVSLSVIARAFKTNVHYDVSHAKIDVMTSGALDANGPDEMP